MNATTDRTIFGTLTVTTMIKCSLPLTGLARGQYTITVRNTDGSSITGEDGFMVMNQVPTSTSISPVSAYNISSVQVTITGTKFISNSQTGRLYREERPFGNGKDNLSLFTGMVYS